MPWESGQADHNLGVNFEPQFCRSDLPQETLRCSYVIRGVQGRRIKAAHAHLVERFQELCDRIPVSELISKAAAAEDELWCSWARGCHDLGGYDGKRRRGGGLTKCRPCVNNKLELRSYLSTYVVQDEMGKLKMFRPKSASK